MTKLTAAQQLAEQGFYVFRLKPNAKTPAFQGWQQEATRDPDKITSYFDNNRDYNIGVFTERFGHPDEAGVFECSLVVVDVDTKEGKNGATTMQNLDAMGYDFPPTITVTTASGGKHLIYQHDTPLASGANKIGPHVDLKSSGAYIVGAGSTIDGKAYTIDHNPPSYPEIVPSWLPKRCLPPAPKASQASSIADDSEQAVSRATQLASITEASSGGRNDQAYKLGCKIRDLGLSETMTEEILHKWNVTNVSPPMNPEEITAVTGFVYKHAKLAQGNKSPQSEFSAVPYDPKIDETPQNKKLYYILPKDIDTATEITPLIEDYFDQAAVSILYGASNSGKTFVALDIAYHVATGEPWNQHFTTKGAVAYLAAEGGRSATNRIQALKDHYRNDDFPLALIPCQVNLFDSHTDLKAFCTLIEDAETNIAPIRLIVIDTLSRAMSGGNENDSMDMGEFVKNITFIKERFKCHVLIVHHSGKDSAKGARGHSLLRAAVDTELEISENRITTTKQRDMEFAKPLGFELKILTLGTTARDKPITSCVVTYHDAEAREEFKMEPRDTICLLALQSVKNHRKVANFENVVDEKFWKQVCKDFNTNLVAGSKPWPKTENSFHQAFYRSRDRLVGFGLVEEVEDKQWVILNHDTVSRSVTDLSVT